jgi:DNA-binding NarL/FixJ family response regulator
MAVNLFIAEDSRDLLLRLLSVVASFPELHLIGIATDVPSCIARTQALRPDLMILDLSMPGGSGLTVLRGFETWADRPIIIVYTNHATERYRKACLELGAAYFVDKSGEVQELKHAIESAIGDCNASSDQKKPGE